MGGLLLYLDCQPPSLKCAPTHLAAWQLLSNNLQALAHNLADGKKHCTEARRGLYSLRNNDGVPSEHMDAAAQVLVATTKAMRSALQQWEKAQELLRQREWWLDCHLHLPTLKNKLSHLMKDGVASVETLSVLAIVQYAIVCSLQAQQVRRLRECTPESDDLLMSLDESGHAIREILRDYGEKSLYKTTVDGLEDIGLAHSASLSSEEIGIEGMAAAVAMASGRRDHVSISDWISMPLGGFNEGLGSIMPLEKRWWMAFPQIRRRARQEREPKTTPLERSNSQAELDGQNPKQVTRDGSQDGAKSYAVPGSRYKVHFDVPADS